MPYQTEALAVLKAYLAKLELGKKAEFLLLAKQWGVIEDELMVMIDKLVEMEIKSPDQLFKMQLYKKFLEELELQIDRYSKIASGQISNQQKIFGKAGIECVQQQIGLKVSFFDKLPIDTINAFIGKSYNDGAKLEEVIQRISPQFADRVKSKLLQGIALGRSPRETARLIRQEDMSIPYWKSLQVSRTETLMIFRETSQMAMARSGVVSQKERIEESDSCPECQAVNHKITKIDEDGGPWHPNCRGCEIAYFG